MSPSIHRPSPMHATFWHQKWAQKEIGFHQSAVHPLLATHWPRLQLELKLAADSRVLVPLCGKTLDIHWLLARGHRVVGVELSEQAVVELFEELGQRPTISPEGALQRYSAPGLDVLVGDFFALTREQLGPVDAVYDRAALVALPDAMRRDYAAQLLALSAQAPQLLICFEYEQSLLAGPPFAVHEAELRQHYGTALDLALLQRAEVPGGLKGRVPAADVAWRLTRR